MTRPRQTPDLRVTLRQQDSRLRALEHRGRDVVTPVSTTAATTINQTAAQTPFMALVNATGGTIAWWVWVNPTVGTTTTLQLRADDGAVGSPVQAASDAASVVTVSMPIPPNWTAGTLHMVYLDAYIDVNSATVTPARALVS